MSAKYIVTRAGQAGHFELYHGFLKHRAVDAYDRALPEPGTVVTLTRISDGNREVIRRSDEVVTLRCHICEEPLTGDYAPAVDAMNGQATCDSCCRSQRHARLVHA